MKTEKITFPEFKKWLKNFVISKKGRLPDVSDWREIKTMMDSVDVSTPARCTDCGGYMHHNICISCSPAKRTQNSITEACDKIAAKCKFLSVGVTHVNTNKLVDEIIEKAIANVEDKLYIKPTTVHNCGIPHNSLIDKTEIDMNSYMSFTGSELLRGDNTWKAAEFVSQFE